MKATGSKRQRATASAESASPALTPPVTPSAQPPAPAAAAAAPAAPSPPAAAPGAPFVFQAGTQPHPPPPPPRPARDTAEEAAETAVQRVVESCRAGDAAALASRLPAANVNRPCRQGAAAGFAAPPLWWCASPRRRCCGRGLDVSRFPFFFAGSPICVRPARRASETGQPDCVRLLLQAGADVEARGRTPRF